MMLKFLSLFSVGLLYCACASPTKSSNLIKIMPAISSSTEPEVSDPEISALPKASRVPVETLDRSGKVQRIPEGVVAPIVPADYLQQVEPLLLANEYQKIRALIASAPKQHAQYQQLQHTLLTIDKAEQDYADIVGFKARVLNEQQQWGQSIELLQQTLQKLPKNQQLIQVLEDTKSHRDRAMQSSQLSVSIARAQFLQQVMPQFEQFNVVYPDQPEYTRQYQHAMSESQRLAKSLAKYAQTLQSDLLLPQGYEVVLLAKQLDPSDFVLDVYAQIEKKQAEKTQEQARLREQKIDYWSTIFAINLAPNGKMEAQDSISTARDALSQLALLGVDTTKKQALLKTRTSQLVESGLKIGKRLFSRGDIEPALKKWRELQVYAPENAQLAQYIAQAEKFIQNINRFNSLKTLQ